MRKMAETSGKGREMYQAGERREAKASGKRRSGRRRNAAPFPAAFLKFKAGIFKAKLVLSSVKHGQRDAFSKTPPEAKMAKSMFRPQMIGFFEAKEAARARDSPAAATGKSWGGLKRACLTSFPPRKVGEKESRSSAPQRTQN